MALVKWWTIRALFPNCGIILYEWWYEVFPVQRSHSYIRKMAPRDEFLCEHYTLQKSSEEQQLEAL